MAPKYRTGLSSPPQTDMDSSCIMTRRSVVQIIAGSAAAVAAVPLDVLSAIESPEFMMYLYPQDKKWDPCYCSHTCR